METVKIMLKNGWTTASGIAAAFIYYLSTSGAKIPSNKEELKNLLVAATLFALGLTSKSAAVGSKP